MSENIWQDAHDALGAAQEAHREAVVALGSAAYLVNGGDSVREDVLRSLADDLRVRSAEVLDAASALYAAIGAVELVQ